MVDSAKFHFRLQKAQFHMAISCHIGVIDNGRNRYRIIEYWRTKTTLHVHGVNESRKIIAFSHLNSTNFKDNFMGEKVKPTLVVLILSPLRLGGVSNCFLMTSFTSFRLQY